MWGYFQGLFTNATLTLTLPKQPPAFPEPPRGLADAGLATGYTIASILEKYVESWVLPLDRKFC